MTARDTGQDPAGVQTTTPQLNIASHEHLRQFLKVIQPKFLEVVDPRESGLLDILYSTDLLTDTDHESMSGKDVNTRKDQARKLWFLLNKFSVADFTTSVVPELCRLYPHIIPERFQAQDVDIEARKECLRHDIMSRIRVATMADMLYQHDCLCFEEYRDIASSEHGCHDVSWAKMFDSCANKDEHLTTGLVRGFQTLLQRFKVQAPACLTEVVSRGIPCTCNTAEAVLPASPAFGPRNVASWLKKSPFQRIPRSSGSFSTGTDSRSFSGAGPSVRDDDSQSISSDNTVVPDLLTTFPAHPRVGFDHAAASLTTTAETNQVVPFAKSSLVDCDAVSVMAKYSETPAVSKQLESGYSCPNPTIALSRENAVSITVEKHTPGEMILDSREPQENETKKASLSLTLKERLGACSGYPCPAGLFEMPLIVLLVIICVLFGVFLWTAHYVCDFNKYCPTVMSPYITDLQERVHKIESLIFSQTEVNTLLFPTANTTDFPDS